MPACSPTRGIFRRHPTLRRLVAATLGAMTLGGCTTLKRTTDRPETLLARRPRLLMRLTLHGGARLTLSSPLIKGDSLVGYPPGDDGSHPLTTALRDVEYAETEQFSAGRTVTLVVVALGATAVFVVSTRAGTPSHSVPVACKFCLGFPPL
jgi:hypothetical protein